MKINLKDQQPRSNGRSMSLNLSMPMASSVKDGQASSPTGSRSIKQRLNKKDQVINVSKDENISLVNMLDNTSIEKKLSFLFSKSEIKCNIDAKFVVQNESQLNLDITIVIPENISQIEANLDIKALVLDSKSNVVIKPILEIASKYVKVNHSSTIGRPPKSWIQYMQTRGLAEDEILDIFVTNFLENA